MATKNQKRTTSLYSIEDETIRGTTGIDYSYLKVSPTGTNGNGGNIDILSNHTWKRASGKIDEVPYIVLYEYQLTYGKWTQNLMRILTGVLSQDDTNDPYAGLYEAAETGFNYVFPYLLKENSTIRGSVNNSWRRESPIDIIEKAPLIGRATKAVKFFGNVFSTGYGTEKIVSFNDTTPKSITIEFPLYNTISEKTAIDNFNFVNLFAIQNLKIRTSFLTYVPPKIYKVQTSGQGGVYMPAAYVESYDFVSIGTTRLMKDSQYSYNGGEGILIPEAYKVIIKLTEIVPESANIMFGALGGDPVNVIKATPFNNTPTLEFNQDPFPMLNINNLFQ
jgi:hypothetical protein